MSTGATDGRFLRNAGIPTYGVSGLFVDATDNRTHGVPLERQHDVAARGHAGAATGADDERRAFFFDDGGAGQLVARA